MKKKFAGYFLALFSLLGQMPTAEAGLILDIGTHIQQGINNTDVGAAFYNGSHVGGGSLYRYNDYLLMTGHQVGSGPINVSALQFRFASNAFDTTVSFVNAKNVFLPSNYDPTPGSPGDYFLVQLAQPVVNATPAPVYTGAINSGDLFTVTGYGYQQLVNDPNILVDGHRRTGTNFVDRVGFPNSAYFRSSLKEFGLPGFHPDQMGGTPNDSGGNAKINGMFVGLSDFANVGFNSFGHQTYYLRPNYGEMDSIITAVPEPTSLTFIQTALIIGVAVVRVRPVTRQASV